MREKNYLMKVEKENREYAKVLMQDYAGMGGALSATLDYSYQQIIQNEQENAFVNSLFSIQKMKMKQLEILGKLIYLLGEDPVYATYDSKIPRTIPYVAARLCYKKEPKDFLLYDLKQEEMTLERYMAHQKLIKDSYIQAIFSFMIEEEEIIIRKLEELMQVYTKENASSR